MLFGWKREKFRHFPVERMNLQQKDEGLTRSCFSLSFSIWYSSHCSSTYCRNFCPFTKNSRPCSPSHASISDFNFFSSFKSKKWWLQEKTTLGCEKNTVISQPLCFTLGRCFCSSDLCFSSLRRLPPLFVNRAGSVAFFYERKQRHTNMVWNYVGFF